MHSPSLKILSGNAPHGKYTVRTAGHARSHTGASANPHAILKGDVSHNEIEGGFLVVVVAAKEQGALGETAVASNRDLTEVVDPHIFANPRVVAYDKLPRVLDGDARLEDHAAPHFGAEQAQKGALEGAGPREPG